MQTEQYLELEQITAQLVSPLMTTRGVFFNGKVTPPPKIGGGNLYRAKSAGKRP